MSKRTRTSGPYRRPSVDTDPKSGKQPFRVLPRLDDANRHYWTGGEHGELRILRCGTCGTWVHPPAPICPSCRGRSLAPAATSGRAVLHTYTVNRQPWYPGLEPPYVVGIVELPEQAGLRLTAGIVGVDPAGVRIGMPLRVVFERYEDVWLPFFEPEPGRV
ncbi:MAG: Zn-ribbon domain-containing OB-fold protein [Acidimicrobiales bacterium]